MSTPSRPRLERKSQCRAGIEKCRCITRARAFDRQQAKLGRNPAACGEAAGLAACRQHAVARHNDRKRVAPERLPDLVRQTLSPRLRLPRTREGKGELFRDLAVGARRAGRNGARDLINPAIEGGDWVHVESDPGKIDQLTMEECTDCSK